MRAIVVHILAALLIAIFAIGSSFPAKADCAKCHDCSAETPVKNDSPCPEKGLACQVASACASQVQRVPVPINFDERGASSRASFGSDSSIAIKSAYLTPETAPPRA